MTNLTQTTLQVEAQKMADFLNKTFQPQAPYAFFLQFGSGFDCNALFKEQPQELLLRTIPGQESFLHPDFIEPTFYSGKTKDDIPILVLAGHRQSSEGNGLLPLLIPVTAAHLLKIHHHIYIEPAISLNTEMKPGSWAVLSDFINGHSVSPLDGQNHWLENSYPDLNEALSQEQNSHIINNLHKVGIQTRLCTYLSIPGYHLCTAAEVKNAASEADILGHNLVMEIILAYAMGCQVSACVLITGQIAVGHQRKINRKDILETCKFCSQQFMRGLALICSDYFSYQQNPPQPVLPNVETDEILHKNFTIKANKPLKLKLKIK
ncbi:MAG: hypothetical protein WCS73_07255 [Lentisphaeria bacterium]